MPPLSTFPKSQQVTFKYYEGVLCFLEEDYIQVVLPRWFPSGATLANSTAGREASDCGLEQLS